MTGLIKRYRDFQTRRQQRWVERWAKTREKGKARFVLRCAVLYPVLMTIFNDFYGYVFDGGVPSVRLWFILKWFVIGFIAGFPSWSMGEGEYTRELTKRRQGI